MARREKSLLACLFFARSQTDTDAAIPVQGFCELVVTIGLFKPRNVGETKEALGDSEIRNSCKPSLSFDGLTYCVVSRGCGLLESMCRVGDVVKQLECGEIS